MKRQRWVVLSICGSAISVVILAGFQTPRVAGSRPADVKLRPFPCGSFSEPPLRRG